MKKKARVLKLGLTAVMLFGIAMGPVMMVDNAMGEEVERIPFKLPTLKADKMPPVFFSHDKHIAALDDDCSLCHTESEEFFLDSEKMGADKVVAYVHESCVSCHSEKGKGPALASCRSCHNDATAAKQAADAKK